jgi:hypothetical protein
MRAGMPIICVREKQLIKLLFGHSCCKTTAPVPFLIQLVESGVMLHCM